MNEPLPLNKQTFDKEVIMAARRNLGTNLVNTIETWRSNHLKTFSVNATNNRTTDVMHLWALAIALRQNLVRDNLSQILGQPNMVDRVGRWLDETTNLCSILNQAKKNSLGQLVHFLEGSDSGF